MEMWMRSFAPVLTLVLAASACEDGATDTTTFDEAALRADVALVAADGMFQDLAHMESATFWAGTGFAPEAAGIEFQGNISFNRTVTFLNEAGEEQERYDPISTASIHVVSSFHRIASHSFWSADIKRDRDMMVTGLLNEETQRTWNGTGNSVVSKSRHPQGGALREYDMTGTASIENVVRGVPRFENPYPLSGTITRDIHVIRTVDGVTVERDIRAVITFNGTQFASMEVDGEVFQVDLAEGGLRQQFKGQNG